MMRHFVASVVVVALTVPVIIAAQSVAGAGSPAFEAASIKPNKSGDKGGGMNLQPGGRFIATGVTLQQLIAAAYNTAGPPLPDYQISGGPQWIASDRFDIVAKAAGDPLAGPKPVLPGPGGAPPGAQQMNLMLRTLLADRFLLTVHHESRELPIYALVMARSDGKVGPALRKTEVDCAAAVAARGKAPGGPFCGTNGGFGRLMFSSVTMETLATVLSRSVGRTVVNRTGLAGIFDGNLEWTPDQPTPSLGGAPPGKLPSPPTDAPSIFSAVQEQLGLKLESTRGPVDVVVIEHVEPPTPD